MGFWNVEIIATLVVAMVLCLIYFIFIRKGHEYKNEKTSKERKESYFKHWIGIRRKFIEGKTRRKEYSYLEDHLKWVRDRIEGDWTKGGDDKVKQADESQAEGDRTEGSRLKEDGDKKKPKKIEDRNVGGRLREDVGKKKPKKTEEGFKQPPKSGNKVPSLSSYWAADNGELSSDLKTLFRDKLHLFQKLNYHRVVEEMNRQIWFVTVLLVVVAIGCFVLPFIYYKASTLEPEANSEYAAFIRKIDTLHNEAGFISNPGGMHSENQAVRRNNLPDREFIDVSDDELSIFRRKAMDAKFLAMAEFSTGYTSFLFLKQALIRVVTMVFLFTILGYLLRMYRRLLDKRTRFRQLEEATTITLFYLFKKVTRAETQREKDEAFLIRENLPKMIDKLYDFSVIEPAKGGKDDERINSTISEMNKAIHDVYKMIADLQQSSRSRN